MVALSSISHTANNTERAPAATEILMVLREVDFCPLSETPSFTSVFNDTPKMRNKKNNLNNNKLVQINSVIRNNLITIQ